METLTLKHAIFSALGQISVPVGVVNRLYPQQNEQNVCSVDWKNFLLNRKNTQWRFVRQNMAETSWPDGGNFNLRLLRQEMLKEYARDDAFGFYALLAQYLQSRRELGELYCKELLLTEELKNCHPEHQSYRRYLTAILLAADEYSSPYAAILLRRGCWFDGGEN